MKKVIIILFSMLLLAGISIDAQINPIKRPQKNTEQTKNNNASKKSSKSTSRTTKTDNKKTNSRSKSNKKSNGAYNQSESDRIIYTRPRVIKSYSKTTRIESVELDENQTAILFSITNPATGGWMFIHPKAHIIANGKVYDLMYVEGITLAPEYTFFDYAGQTKTFTLYFPPIPFYVSSIDFVEAEDSEWQFYGIQLSSSSTDTLLIESSNSSIVSQEQKDRIIRQAIENMISVEGGTFTMGATNEQGSEAEKVEKPSHQVTVSSFFISKYEVTQELWVAVMGDNPSRHYGCPEHPVEMVSWDDCQIFINKLNQLTGKKFRLPTEAEWEFAARGGNLSQNYKFSGSNRVHDVAWYKENSAGESHKVGIRVPNKLGLFDMSGNVCEWCQDWYGEYTKAAQYGPSGPLNGKSRIVRGGGWDIAASSCRTSYRNYLSPSTKLQGLGFRLAASSL